MKYNRRYIWALLSFTMTMQSHIIYLNGASSVGKSTLAQALQQALEPPYLCFGIDTMIAMMPAKCNDFATNTYANGFSFIPTTDNSGSPVYALHMGKFGKKTREAMMKLAVAMAQAGHNLIIDDVSLGAEQAAEWRSALAECDVLWVGLTAPLEIIEERERARGDRRVGSARWQAHEVHKGVTYDLLLDTFSQSIEDNVKLISSRIL